MKNDLRILIAGEGGQGIQVIAKILTEAAFASGKKVAYLPNFGVEQRGGVSLAFVQISDAEISFPKFHEADIVVILAERAIARIAENIGKHGKIIFDNSIVSPGKLDSFHNEKIAIPASLVAKEKIVPKVFNMIILGALVLEIGGIDAKYVKKSLQKNLADKYDKKPELKHFNLSAFVEGQKIAEELKNRG